MPDQGLSTTWQWSLDLLFAKMNLVVFLVFMVKTCNYPQLAIISDPKIFLEVFFLAIRSFSVRKWFFTISKIRDESFDIRILSLVDLNRNFFLQKHLFCHFWLPGSGSQDDFLNVEARCWQIRGNFPGRNCYKRIVFFNWGFNNFRRAGG